MQAALQSQDLPQCRRLQEKVKGLVCTGKLLNCSNICGTLQLDLPASLTKPVCVKPLERSGHQKHNLSMTMPQFSTRHSQTTLRLSGLDCGTVMLKGILEDLIFLRISQVLGMRSVSVLKSGLSREETLCGSCSGACLFEALYRFPSL